MVKTMEASTKRRRKPLKIHVSLAFFIRSQGIFSAQKVIIEIIFLEELEDRKDVWNTNGSYRNTIAASWWKQTAEVS